MQNHRPPEPACSNRLRVLFMAEAVTLAHVARPAVLAESLDPARYEVHLASDPRYDHLLRIACPRHRIRSVPSQQFLAALAAGSPLYDAATLRSYVKEDLAVLDEIRPDVVVGDFRLSLSVSARLRKIPYITISNAYWSPYARLRYPLPEIPPAKWLGVPMATGLFKAIRPVAFAYHTRPLNRVRRQYGLASLGWDLRRIYTDADYTVYADVPLLRPLTDAPPHHEFLGPILWSPSMPLPPWWDELPKGKPLVYVTLGSSGRSDLLETVLDALADVKLCVIAATAGRVNIARVPENAFLADFLPGEEAAGRASLVICNGGSPTTQQALVQGCPVLGVPSNLDQYLNMDGVCRAGAGRVVRAGRASVARIRRAVQEILEDERYVGNAQQVREACREYDPLRRFEAVLCRASLEPRAPAGDKLPRVT